MIKIRVIDKAHVDGYQVIQIQSYEHFEHLILELEEGYRLQ